MAKKTWLRGAALALIAALVLAGCSKGGSSGGGTAKASNIKAAPASDFSYDLTADKSGIIIKKYTGKGSKVAIPATIEGMPVTEIGARAFWDIGLNAITEIFIPDGVTKIGLEAFKELKNLTKANLPAGIEEIGYSAFNTCQELNNLIIPDSLSSVKFLNSNGIEARNNAFLSCGKLPLATRTKIESLGYTSSF
jgi:hypothetical protein